MTAETSCALPLRAQNSSLDERTARSAQRLAEALNATPEFQAFLSTARAVNTDPEVRRLVQAIRVCRSSFDCTHSGALQSELQALPVMTAYAQAQATLKTLVTRLDKAISDSAGLSYVANVRPDKHT
ncbi:MAG: YlbF family regulator [Anaerolineae bacterium]|nr:YlbF family regulator [Anaerolineae bacterium]